MNDDQNDEDNLANMITVGIVVLVISLVKSKFGIRAVRKFVSHLEVRGKEIADRNKNIDKG